MINRPFKYSLNLSPEGLPPTEDIEREWLRYEQELERRGTEGFQKNVLQETAPAQLTHTTAEPRPNAYIPDDIGIPKPYGALAPFKPSELGATMRHIRRPASPVSSPVCWFNTVWDPAFRPWYLSVSISLSF